MKPQFTNSDPRFSLHQDGVLANAAILYYKEGLTQNEIAIRLGVSRPTVNSYLRAARDQGIVDIRINGSAFSASGLSRELRDKFQLDDVYVAAYGPEPGSDNYRIAINKTVARVGAMALHEILRPGELIGANWGETMQFLSEEVPYRFIENLTVCQLNGSMHSPLISAAESVAIRISSRLGAECFTLHAPAVLSSPELAAALKSEPAIRHQLQRFNSLDRAIFSVGNCDANTPMVQISLTTKQEIECYKEGGAVGVLCGHFINQHGERVDGPVDDRMIGVTLEQIRNTQGGILVAGGVSKFHAIQATLNGGYVSHLVTDELIARMLLEE